MDTIAIADQLEAAGTPPAQARAHARILHQAIEARAATKADLQTATTDLRAEIAELRAELKAVIAELRAELKAVIAVLRKELQLQRWMLGATGALLIVVLVKLFTL